MKKNKKKPKENRGNKIRNNAVNLRHAPENPAINLLPMSDNPRVGITASSDGKITMYSIPGAREFEKIKEGELKFDPNLSKIFLRAKECEIPSGTIEFYICRLLFGKAFGEKVTEGEIMTLVDAEKCKAEHMRTVYDAHRRINEKVKVGLGIPKLLDYGAAQVWIRREIFE